MIRWLIGMFLCFAASLDFANLYATKHGALYGLLSLAFIIYGLSNFPTKYLPQLRPRKVQPVLPARAIKPRPQDYVSELWKQQ